MQADLVVRIRSAAATAAALPAPHQGRHLLRTLLLKALLVAAGCSSAAVRSEPSNLGNRAPSSAVRSSHVGGSTTSPPMSFRKAWAVAIETAWANSKGAYYRAALTGNPRYPPLLATLVRGGPVYVHTIAYLSALVSMGVRGPPRWRIGNEHVVSIGAGQARLEGCLFDTGSVWRSTGVPAPPSLGGGAGLTASDATLVLEGGRWLVLSDEVSAVSSPKEPGPCHGF